MREVGEKGSINHTERTGKKKERRIKADPIVRETRKTLRNRKSGQRKLRFLGT